MSQAAIFMDFRSGQGNQVYVPVFAATPLEFQIYHHVPMTAVLWAQFREENLSNSRMTKLADPCLSYQHRRKHTNVIFLDLPRMGNDAVLYM
jgi:hypothetical protein